MWEDKFLPLTELNLLQLIYEKSVVFVITNYRGLVAFEPTFHLYALQQSVCILIGSWMSAPHSLTFAGLISISYSIHDPIKIRSLPLFSFPYPKKERFLWLRVTSHSFILSHLHCLIVENYILRKIRSC